MVKDNKNEDTWAFVLGASIASGRVFWVGQGGTSSITIGKKTSERAAYAGVSKDGKVALFGVK